METRKSGVKLDELPKTFREAVIIAQRLSIRYLWIDSLCIIQDDSKDWYSESAKMATIYANSHLTIAASAAENNNAGCFERQVRRYVPINLGATQVLACNLPLGKAALDRYYLEMSDEPLSKRAWALQERVMSRRVLHCATDQMYFECNEHFLSEDGFSARGRLDSLYPGPEPSFSIIDRESKHSPAHTLWNLLLEEYTGRELTVAEDRLPALAGLARLFAEKLGATYVAGLWSDSIISDLAWYGLGQQRRPKDAKNTQDLDPAPSSPYIALSWSWADYFGVSARSGAGWEDVASVLDYHVDLAGDDPFGRVTGGWMRIRAPLVPLSISEIPTNYTSSRRMNMVTPWGSAQGSYLNCDSADRELVLSVAPVFGLVLSQNTYPEPAGAYEYTLLVVAAFDGESRGMKRLGCMEMDFQEFGNRAVIEDTDGFEIVTLV